ncbi:hypothetical protein [Ferruginibacter sp. SUN106]|uniref:hypothetical protein n=1 Tax=Ferruginibacter sp. SUN106 TaxID=2978348 RepID=UPI003D369940
MTPFLTSTKIYLLKHPLEEIVQRFASITARDFKERSSICGRQLSDVPAAFEFYVPAAFFTNVPQIKPFRTEVKTTLTTEGQNTKIVAITKPNLLFLLIAILSIAGMVTVWLTQKDWTNFKSWIIYPIIFIAMFFTDRISKSIVAGTLERYIYKK